MKKVLTIITVAVWLGAAQSGSTLSASEAGLTAGTVKVTVNYKGKGKVDPSHQIWVWLFDTPNIGPGAMPINQVSLDKNGAEAIFTAVAAEQVWIAVAYDEAGAMTGDGPPPTGTPIGLLVSKEGAPAPVTPGEKGAVSLTFDESIRMP